MAINLKEMSRKELKKLREDVDHALVEAENRERKDALKAAEKAAAEFGYSLSDLSGDSGFSKSGRGGKKRSKSEPKYRNPENPDQTWSGLGRKPQWFHDAVSNNVDLADLEI